MTNDVTNDVTNADRCPSCGGMYTLIGHRHRCVPRARPVTVKRIDLPQVIKSAEVDDAGQETGATVYRFRNPDKWRAYMRIYMRGWRARQKSNSAAVGG